MPESTNEINSIRDKKQDAIEKGEVAITSHDYVEEAEQEYNSASDSVFRVDELLTVKNDHPVIRKLNRLKQFGLTDEMILNAYNDLSGNVVTETAAMEVLKIVFDRYVEYFSELPNGIVLDPTSGRIDFEASYEQRLELGILTDPFQGIDLSKKISIDDILNLDRKELEKGFKAHIEVYKELAERFENINVKDAVKKDIKEASEKKAEELKLSDKHKAELKEVEKEIDKSEYRIDPDFYEILSLEVERREKTGSEKSALDLQIKEFYKKKPEYRDKVKAKIYNKKGEPKKPIDFIKYKKNVSFEIISNQINELYEMSKEDFDKLGPDEKKNATMELFRGYFFKEKNNDRFELLGNECEKILSKLYPELDLDKKTSKTTKETLAKISKEVLGLDGDFDEITYNMFREFVTDKYDKSLDEVLRTQKDFSKNRQNTIKIQEYSYEKVVEEFFVGSKLSIGEAGKAQYEDRFKSAAVNSWIEQKNIAILYRYMSLLSMKEILGKEDSEYSRAKLADIERQMEEFKNKYGDRLEETYGNPETWKAKEMNIHQMEYRNYRNQSYTEALTSHYTKDMMEFQRGKTYADMSKEEKKLYIRNSLAIYSRINDNPPDVLVKVALRRIELMNTDEKKFIIFDENGGFKIDENLLLEEYRATEPGKDVSSFEELVALCEQKKDIYAFGNLSKIVEQKDEEFLIIGRRNNLDKAFTQVEEAKMQLRENRIKEVKGKQSEKTPEARPVDATKVKQPENELETRGVGFAKEKQPETNSKTDLNNIPIADSEATRTLVGMQEEMNTSGIDELSRKVATSKKERADGNTQNSQAEVEEDKRIQTSGEPVIEETEDAVDSSTSGGNMEAVSMDDSAVTNALVPIEETNKLKKLGAMLTNILSSIKNKLVLKKKEEPEHDEVRKDAVSVLKDSKGNDFKNQGPIVTYEQQKENAMKMQGTQITQTPQKNQVKNIDTQSDYEGPSI